MESRPSDEMLLLAVADRDMGAFHTLYERHAGWLAIRRLVSRLRSRGGVAAVSGHAEIAPAARHAEVRRVLDQVGLSDLVIKRTRVALAQALLGSPVRARHRAGPRPARYDGQLTELVRPAAGRVWLADQPDPAATVPAAARRAAGQPAGGGGGGVVNATLAPARLESAACRTTFVAVAAREMRRFVVNPVFVFAVAMTAWTTWDDRKGPVTAVGTGTGTRGSSWAGSA